MIRILYYSHTSLSLPEIFSKKSAKKFDKKASTTALENLVRKGVIKKAGKGCYAIDPSAPLYKGKLIQNAKGFGFVQANGIGADTQTLQRDLFIAKTNMNGAMHDDTVLVLGRIDKNGKRTEGIILDIIEQRTNSLAGIVSKRGHEIFVYPDDPRFPFKVSLKERKDIVLKSGDAVIVEYKRPTLPTPTLAGKLVTLLGDAEDIDTQMKLVMSSHDLPHIFKEDVTEETAQLKDSFEASDDRTDLRKLQHITIDGETAKDFDDAICVEKTSSGYRLYVSIADVSHFVSPGSAIDKEAYLRGTSVYFPGRVIPMLPERLSNNLCSLVPHEDRYTVSAILDFDKQGKLLHKDFARTIIHSQQRFTYTTVRQILVDKDPEVQQIYEPFIPLLNCAGELASALQQRRTLRGSIDFNLTEPFFTLADDGKIASISPAERNFAHQIIEEFMLAANEAVASFFIEKEIPAIFRTHEAPDELKLADFLTFINSLGMPLAPFKNEAAWFADTIKKCKGSKYDYIVNNLLLRSLKQAQYTASNIGHFGLAAPAYTHFTSPIRRYPDLIVHRLLLSLISSNKGLTEDDKRKSYQDAGTFLSARERIAITAERDMNDRLKIAYMKDKVGEHFSAIISGVTENSVFVEIVDLCISGAVPVDLLTDDYYLFDKKNYRLFGEMSAKTYQIGDSVEIILVDVDHNLRRLTFKMSDNE
ncbi:ribonuclease R [Desulforhopalus sp. IMCC35007]|uniref:ribonuclease R n=1 Tax=Desulforhopalus sp. IMCC35007 TaxID=2569543 RepID=UPI00145CAB91|nr:ribonuclease R [Desulforhopalus sp. IMCC35007]